MPAQVQPREAAAKQPIKPLLEPGTRVAHYELIRALGRGGMGEVHLARDVRLGRLVALKFLLPSNPEVGRMVLVEARATAKCTHENIVVIHDIDEYEGMPYLVLEYLEGKSLGRLHAESPLPLVRLVELIIGVVRALDHAHRAGIVHRDLKPENIFVTTSGSVKVLDFGIAKLHGNIPTEPTPVSSDVYIDTSDQTELTISSNGPIGTRPYMSPEQWAGHDIDGRSDLWSVGVLLFRLVTGEFPFSHFEGHALMYAVMSPSESARSVTQLVPDFHPALAEIIDRCLRKAKNQRFASARALLDALEPLLPRAGTPVDDRCPYPGLLSFQESDAERFFGREDQIARVVGRLAGQSLLAIVGPSGAGKSSFVRAGVVPALKREAPWATIALRPGRSPLLALAQLADPVHANDTDYVRGIAGRMFDEPGYLGAILRWRASQHGCRVLLYVDQFEELYTLVRDPNERRAFVASLSAAADDPSSPVRVLISMRSDFLDRGAEDRGFMARLIEGMHYLTPLGHEGLRQALQRPAEQSGHAFESQQLVTQIISEVAATSGALPLLQFAAARMWEARDRSRRTLTTASYQAMGGIAGALVVHADTVVAELPPPRRQLAQALFQRLVTPDGTRAIVDLEELLQLGPSGEVRELLDLLVSARLLVSKSDDHGAGATVELIHESLITAWPQLRQWVDANREDTAALIQVRQAAQQWEARGHPQGLLWRGDAADDARRISARLGATLGPRERRFIDSVIADATRATRIKRIALAATIFALAGLVIVGLVVVIWVHRAEQEALRQASEARAARSKIAEQLQIVQDAEKARITAQQQADAAQQKADAAQQKADSAGQDAQESREQLRDRNRQLNEALDMAHKATDEQKALREKVERLLVEERKRADALTKQRNRMATELR